MHAMEDRGSGGNQWGSQVQGMGVVINNWLDRVLPSVLYVIETLMSTDVQNVGCRL